MAPNAPLVTLGPPISGRRATSIERRLYTTRFGLSLSEATTTTLAVAASTGLYIAHGKRYLALGVVGDLIGLAGLGGVLALRRQRLRHEAGLCMVVILLTLWLSPKWPLRIASKWWWMAWAIGLTGYLIGRRKICK